MLRTMVEMHDKNYLNFYGFEHLILLRQFGAWISNIFEIYTKHFWVWRSSSSLLRYVKSSWKKFFCQKGVSRTKNLNVDKRKVKRTKKADKFNMQHQPYHCVKNVQIRSFLRPVFSRIRTEYGEILRIFT